MDRSAFTDAVHQFQDMVFRTALHSLGSCHDADDAVQEVFLRLYKSPESFDSQEHLRRWLLRVTVNYCRDVLKSAWRRKRVSLQDLPEVPAFETPEQGGLFREVMALPEKYRTVLNLFYYEELSVREIADLLHLRQSTVTTQLSRARAQLKERLGEVWQDE